MRVLPILFAAAALAARRPIQLADVPAELHRYLGAAGAVAFDDLRRSMDRNTRERVRLGEAEHLIYFILQSSAFTKRPRIEPAISARRFVEGLSAQDRTRLLETGAAAVSLAPPPEVRARMKDFLEALERPAADERLSGWKPGPQEEPPSLVTLATAYARAMRFLYQKEFLAGKDGASRLYQERGHSVDTQVEANYAVSEALAVIHKLNPVARLERVLIVGPGLDLAPRTGFRDDIPAQSYQPYLTVDSLLRWELAEPERIAVSCADINPRVIRFIEEFRARAAPRLLLAGGSGDADYREYFREAGRRVGSVLDEPRGKAVLVRKELAAQVRAESLNIVTERLDPSPGFDLIIATNVLLYFNPRELALALTNIHSMMPTGGYFIHNELRPEVEAIAEALQMPPIQGRSLQITQGPKRPLVDAFVIHRKQ